VWGYQHTLQIGRENVLKAQNMLYPNATIVLHFNTYCYFEAHVVLHVQYMLN